MQASQFKDHLVNQLIPFWNNLEDKENGGFYGYVDKDLRIEKKASKGVIINSRILWFYSAAYQLLKDEELLHKADQAYAFLKEHCYDQLNGGVYWSLTYDGKPLDSIKHTYNQAFAIYALSEYYMASANKEALELTYEIYELIEGKCRDKDGYLESFAVDFTFDPNNDKLSENGVMAQRTMNTLLHVLEAYTNLYKADHNQKVKENLKTIINIFETKIYDSDNRRMKVFFDKEYNSLIDLYSYGHDIETSWLMDKTKEVLDDDEYSTIILKMTDLMVSEVLKHAYDENTHALFNECENGINDKKKVWWVQAEAVIGFYNAYQKMPERNDFHEASAKIFDFIQKKMIDQRCGEWYENILPDGTTDLSRGIVHEWKGPYHNGRMCIEMYRRLSVTE